MHITVVGGGNSTPIFAALAADAGHTVSILTRKPEAWNKDDIGFVNEDLEYMPQADLSPTLAPHRRPHHLHHHLPRLHLYHRRRRLHHHLLHHPCSCRRRSCAPRWR